MPEIIGSIIIFLVMIVIGKHIYDWYHETEKRNRMMEAQLNLLAQIAAAQGVNIDEIAEIVAEAKVGKKKN